MGGGSTPGFDNVVTLNWKGFELATLSGQTPKRQAKKVSSIEI